MITSIADFIPCENCSAKSVDLHHLIFRSQGGSDEVENIAALCRGCHEKAHSDRDFNEYLKKTHENNLKY